MMTKYPTYDEIVALHRAHAPSSESFDLVFTHCLVIWDIAQQLIETSTVGVDEELVKVGCLLHDIGVYKLYLSDGTIDHKNYIKHGILGYELLKNEGFDEVISRFASCHTGVGLSRDEIIEENLPLPHHDFYATTPEEEIVMYSDKFHTKSTPPKLMSALAYEEYARKFGEAKVDRFKAFQKKYGVPRLDIVADKYGLKVQN